MRNSYLESYYNIIPKIQQDRLLEVLKKQYDEAGTTPDDATLKSQLELLVAELRRPLGIPMIQYRKAKKYSKISSKDYNNTMEEVYVDLGALFKQNNIINKVMKRHQLLNDAVLKDIRAALRKVENDVVVYKIVKENKTGITDAKFNTFYKDDNQIDEAVYRAWIDTDTNSAKLPVGMDHSALSISGLAMSEIDLIHYGGGIKGTIETEEHRKDKAIDEGATTFWGEVILTDEPIKQTYDSVAEFGAICEIVISLFRAEQINHIKFVPFTNYPLSVIKIEYKSDVLSTSQWVDLDVTQQESVSAMEFNFDEVFAKYIKIVINQKNPSVNTYKLPKRVISNAQLWQQIVDREYSISTETDAPIQATQDMIDYITGWRAYVDAIGKYKDKVKDLGRPEGVDSITETLFDAATDEITKTSEKSADELKLDLYGTKITKEDELVEVRKYEYVYGAYNIDVKRLWYLDKGEYISPKYQSNGAIIEAKLDVTEVVPSGTTIEYQVATREDAWKNILPSGIAIEKERLDIDPITRDGILRFPISAEPPTVYRSTEVMPSGASVLDPSGFTFDADTDIVTIASGWYVATAAYTVSYTPDGISDVTPSGEMVSFANDSLIDVDEIFLEAKSREYKVSLPHYPYIDYDVVNDTSNAGASGPAFVYTGGRWLNNSGVSKFDIEPDEYYDVFVVTVNGHSAENRTDYYEDERPALTVYNSISYPNFDYFHSGKNLYFNVPLENYEVRVIYKYLNDYIQFKALLRNNNKSDVTNTPIFEDYTLKLRTL